MQNLSIPAFYKKRNDDGTYDTIFEYLIKNHKLTLAGSDLGENFHRNCNTGFDGYSFTDHNKNNEFETIVFGEIMPPSAGTSINAKGNHFPSKPVNITIFN